MADLIERLRTLSAMINMGEKIAWGEDTALMDEAADRIATLEAALAPFSAQAGRYDPPEDDDNIGIWGGTSITLGMLRAARAALSSSKQKDGDNG